MSRLPVLMLHSIDRSGSVVSTSPEVFATAMDDLAREGWRVRSLSGALDAWKSGDRERVVALSFDDGYLNLRDEAAPVLRRLGFSATVFVIVDRCGDDNRWPGQAGWVPTAPLLDWPDLERLQRDGWEIASHGLGHRPLTTLTKRECVEELEASRRILEQRLGRPVPLFAYPYGVHDESVRALAGEHYEAAFGVDLRAAHAADLAEATQIPRIDAHYLRGWSWPMALGSTVGRGYLAFRRLAGRLRSAPIDYAALEGAGETAGKRRREGR